MQTPDYFVRGIAVPEIDLVLCALRAFVLDEPNILQSALAEPVDWPAFERIAECHSVLPLLAYLLTQQPSGLLPPETRKRLRDRLALASHRNLILIAEWCRLLRAFDEAKIPVISLKGPALALGVYPNFSLREFKDIDLLVRPCDLAKAHDLLFCQGYGSGSPRSHQKRSLSLPSRNAQLELAHKDRGISVDIHWEAWHVMFPFQLPVDLLFESARHRRCETMDFLTLSPENLLIYLCAHATKHCWTSLRWLCDVACHLRNVQNMDWELCFSTAESANSVLVLKHSLVLVHRLFGVRLSPPVAGWVRSAKAEALAAIASTFLLRGDLYPDRRLRAVQDLRYHLGFGETWGTRTRLLLERLFIPDEPNALQDHLPASLHVLSYAAKSMRFVLSRVKDIARAPG